MIPLNTKPKGPVPSPFSAAQQATFDAGFTKAVAKYPPERSRAALLPALHLAQDLLGWLPEAAMAYVGSRLDIPPARVREVATFYTMYKLKPQGRHHIEVCNSVSCWAMGSEDLIKHCESKLGIHKGEITADGHFSLGEAACLAGCGYAPAVLINNYRYAEHMTAEKMDKLIEELKSAPGNKMADFPENKDTGRAH
ncbi:MAG: NAD(P)H-dependent oxidoreductase subunit E [Deltaproteobacteria bacterium]|nr:NAD(P)H-dependent oxidoreductase subunit E [Deltaproteobacteria bacterium]